MRKFFYILLLFPFLLKAQMTDTDKHVYAAGVISFGTASIVHKKTDSMFLGVVSGFGAGWIAGRIKERVWDKEMGRGVYNKQDLKANDWGSVVGGFTFMFVFNLKELRKMRKQFYK